MQKSFCGSPEFPSLCAQWTQQCGCPSTWNGSMVILSALPPIEKEWVPMTLFWGGAGQSNAQSTRRRRKGACGSPEFSSPGRGIASARQTLQSQRCGRSSTTCTRCSGSTVSSCGILHAVPYSSSSSSIAPFCRHRRRRRRYRRTRPRPRHPRRGQRSCASALPGSACPSVQSSLVKSLICAPLQGDHEINFCWL